MAQLIALFQRPGFWLALLALVLLLALLAARLRIRWRAAWFLRVLLVTGILVGLFAANLDFDTQEINQRQVMVIDQSDSISEETRLMTWQQAMRWQAEAENRLVVAFGAETVPVLPENAGEPASPSEIVPSTGPQESEPGNPAVDGRASDLAGALRMAGNLLAGSQGSVILVSDGIATEPAEADALTASLARAGHAFSVVSLQGRPIANDLAVGNLIAPKNLWAGTGFDLLVPVYGNPNPGQMRLSINGRASPIPAEAVGENAFRFRIPDLPQGIVTLEVTASAGLAADGIEDPLPNNNAGFAVMQVFPPPRVLFVSSRAQEPAVANFQATLADNGIEVETVAPELLSTNLDSLERYRVIFLDNLLSSQLTREQMTAVQVFVSRMAGGLVVLGGRNSYTLGGYQGSLLEPMLPVKLEPPPRTQRSPIVFQLVLDRSSSMRVDYSNNDISPILLAREAAMRSIETLRPEDTLGVLTFSDESFWDFPLQPLADAQALPQALAAVGQVRAEGTTFMYQAMRDALEGLYALPADAPSIRHMLVLSDGQSTDGSDSRFRQLAEEAQLRGITVSTIALGQAADKVLLEQIAEAGTGRFYLVEDASQLPRIMISESQAARSENIQLGQTSQKVGESGHPILSSLSPDQLPILGGYNALSSKAEEGAEDVLVSSNFGDPILSAWQYGLGRVAAWTGDLGEEWTGEWQDAESEGVFWSQVVRYALVDPALNPAQVSVAVEPTRLLVDAVIYTPEGEPVNLTEATFRYAGQQNDVQTYRMLQNSAGRYQVEIPRPPEGAYRAVLEYTGTNGEPIEVAAPFAVNPPAEWLPHDPSAGQESLAAWAEAAGGELLSFEALTQPEAQAAGEASERLDGWWWWLLLALVIYWPLEIAIRRRWLPWME